jgi:hypothetical protein
MIFKMDAPLAWCEETKRPFCEKRHHRSLRILLIFQNTLPELAPLSSVTESVVEQPVDYRTKRLPDHVTDAWLPRLQRAGPSASLDEGVYSRRLNCVEIITGASGSVKAREVVLADRPIALARCCAGIVQNFH